MSGAAGMSSLPQLFEQTFAQIYNLLYRLTADRGLAAEATRETFLHGHAQRASMPEGAEDARTWILRIAVQVAERRLVGCGAPPTFDELDETLRSEATRTEGIAEMSPPEHEFLLWELKQTCMTAVVNCLSLGERAAFVLSAILGLDEDRAALVLGIKSSAYKVRLSRARQKVADYLAPRCEHVYPGNPCRCPGRLGVALTRRFIAPLVPGVANVVPRPPFGRYGGDNEPQRDVIVIYRTLPEVDPPPELREQIAGEMSSETWDALSEGQP
jgi:DNA-directed RNA polymerase specialized sigma24 family protein